MEIERLSQPSNGCFLNGTDGMKTKYKEVKEWIKNKKYKTSMKRMRTT